MGRAPRRVKGARGYAARVPQADDEIAWPSTTTYARGIVRRALLQTETCYPAIVDQYRAPAEGRPAQVVVRLCRRYRRPLDNSEDVRDGEDLEESTDDNGSTKYEAVGDYPAIGWVPVEWPGLAGMHLTGQVAVGEVGMLCNTGRSIDAWQTRGGVVDPFGSQQFNLGNAVWRPGVRSGADAVEVPSSGWRLGADDGTWAIEVTPAGQVSIVAGDGAEVRLGTNAATLGVARQTDSVAADATWTAFASAVAGFINGLVPGTVVVPGGTVGTISSSSSTVKAV